MPDMRVKSESQTFSLSSLLAVTFPMSSYFEACSLSRHSTNGPSFQKLTMLERSCVPSKMFLVPFFSLLPLIQLFPAKRVNKQASNFQIFVNSTNPQQASNKPP